jgi:hypothetical protein
VTSTDDLLFRRWGNLAKKKKLSKKDPLLFPYKISSLKRCWILLSFNSCFHSMPYYLLFYVNKKFPYTTNVHLHPPQPPPPVFFISLVYYKTFTITQSFLVHFRLNNCQSITSSLNSPKRRNKTRKPIRKADKPEGTLPITQIKSCHNTENDNIILQLRVHTSCKQLQKSPSYISTTLL